MHRFLLAVSSVPFLSSCSALLESDERAVIRLERLERLVANYELQGLMESKMGQDLLAGTGSSVAIDVGPLGIPRSQGLVTCVVTGVWLIPDQPGWRGILERLQRPVVGGAEPERTMPLYVDLMRTGTAGETAGLWRFDAVPPGAYDVLVSTDDVDAAGRRTRFTYAHAVVSEAGDVATKRFNRFPFEKRRMDRQWYFDLTGDSGDWWLGADAYHYGPDGDPLVESQIREGR